MGAIFQGDELLIILAILLLILGPSKLPALAKGLGQAVREFRKASSGFYDEMEETKRQLRTLDTTTPEESKSKIDDATLAKLAEKLGVSTEGKSRDVLVQEVIEKAKEKGLI